MHITIFIAFFLRRAWGFKAGTFFQGVYRYGAALLHPSPQLPEPAVRKVFTP